MYKEAVVLVVRKLANGWRVAAQDLRVVVEWEKGIVIIYRHFCRSVYWLHTHYLGEWSNACVARSSAQIAITSCGATIAAVDPKRSKSGPWCVIWDIWTVDCHH